MGPFLLIKEMHRIITIFFCLFNAPRKVNVKLIVENVLVQIIEKEMTSLIASWQATYKLVLSFN